MANSISVRGGVYASFVIDTNTAGAAVSVLCNREYVVSDFVITNTSGIAISGNISTGAGTISSINALVAGTVNRPASTVAGAGTANLDPTYATVARGQTLAVIITTGSGFCQGVIRLLPGNRYSATTSTTSYYANNSAAGVRLPGASSATTNI